MATPRKQKDSLWLQVVTLSNGQAAFGKYCKEATELSQPITTKNKAGNDVIRHYELYDDISGFVSQVGVFDKEMESGASFEETTIVLKDEAGSLESVKVYFQSKFSTALITRLENIDLTKKVTLKVFRIKTDRKDKNGKAIYNEMILPYQENEKGELVSVKNKYAAEFAESDIEKKNNLNPHKLPEFKKIIKKKKGEEVTEWDTSEYEEALRQICIRVQKDVKQAAEWKKPVENTSTESATGADVSVNENDDLPF